MRTVPQSGNNDDTLCQQGSIHDSPCRGCTMHASTSPKYLAMHEYLDMPSRPACCTSSNKEIMLQPLLLRGLVSDVDGTGVETENSDWNPRQRACACFGSLQKRLLLRPYLLARWRLQGRVMRMERLCFTRGRTNQVCSPLTGYHESGPLSQMRFEAIPEMLLFSWGPASHMPRSVMQQQTDAKIYANRCRAPPSSCRRF